MRCCSVTIASRSGGCIDSRTIWNKSPHLDVDVRLHRARPSRQVCVRIFSQALDLSWALFVNLMDHSDPNELCGGLQMRASSST